METFVKPIIKANAFIDRENWNLHPVLSNRLDVETETHNKCTEEYMLFLKTDPMLKLDDERERLHNYYFSRHKRLQHLLSVIYFEYHLYRSNGGCIPCKNPEPEFELLWNRWRKITQIAYDIYWKFSSETQHQKRECTKHRDKKDATIFEKLTKEKEKTDEVYVDYCNSLMQKKVTIGRSKYVSPYENWNEGSYYEITDKSEPLLLDIPLNTPFYIANRREFREALYHTNIAIEFKL